VPTRNRSALLATTLRSALGQQGVAFEVVVVDEGSSDDTPALLSALGDARVRVLRHETARGLSAARNHGAVETHGEWLAFLDDDDLWAPDKLLRQLETAALAGRDWVYTGSVNIEGCRIVYGQPPLPPAETVAALPRYNAIPGGGSNVVVRRTLWRQAGPFDTRFHGGEDWDLSIRLAKQGPPAWVCQPLMAKRVHSTNMFLDVAKIVRATQLIETLHDTQADWGKLHRWMAHACLRAGGRRAALGHFARAAVRGEGRAVASDLRVLLQRAITGRLPGPGAKAPASDPWRAMAAAWLRQFEGSIQ
jgi:glycosyltransferase involved in cell wall biosynthesis